MGNTCCNYSNKDPHGMEDIQGADGKIKKGGGGGEKPIKMDPKVSEEIMLKVRKHEKKIIRV